MNRSCAFLNANIIPMDGGARYSAILIENGVIRALGTDEEISSLCQESGVIPRDAKGATILPAFFDCHVHALTTGENALGIDLYDCKNIEELLELLREADRTWEPGRWIFGKRLDESRLAEGRPPLMKELDAIPRPVFLSDRGKHYTAVNRAAYDALGITKDIVGVRLDENGEPTGRLQDDGNRTAQARFFATWPLAQKQDAVRYTAKLALSRGITTIDAIEGLDSTGDDVKFMVELRDSLPLDMDIFWATVHSEDVEALGLSIWGGDILLDGAIGSRTAAFSENYCDGNTAGYLNYPDEEVFRMVEEAVVKDLGLSFHCIGELAMTQALDAIERALAHHPEKKAAHKLRLEHFGFPNQRDIDRAGALHLLVSTQPAFTYLRGGPGTVYRSRLGEKRERAGYPLRRFLDAGMILGGGSDSDVTPMDALFGIHAAVNPPYPENAITPYEAVRMYTADAAKCTYRFEQKGTLTVGKQGDLVLLSADPMAVDPRTIKDIQVLETIHKGETVYQKA